MSAKPTNFNGLYFAKVGSISSGTIRSEDLLNTFANELEGHILLNGDFLSRPENFPLRDRLNKTVEDAREAFGDDGETLTPEGEENASELIEELSNALESFAPPYGLFGAHGGDGACFGFWVFVEHAKSEVDFYSSRQHEYPPDDYEGEWLHINPRGNCTLYVRESGKDYELWSVA